MPQTGQYSGLVSGPRCFNCGYSIAHVAAGGVCPECGLPAVDEREVLDGAAVVGRADRVCQNCIVLVLVIGLVALGMWMCAGP